MRPFRHACRALALILLAAPALAAQATPPSPAVADDPDVQAAQRLFTAWMDGQLAYRGLPGVVVGVVAGDELVWARGFGYADVASRRPMTPQTKFRMASHSKLFTATAVMQLREDGKLRLDDPVSQHLPWFRMRPASDDDGPVTVEQLLTHSSGLQREASDHWTSLDFPTAEELRALVPERQAAFPPQTRWKYSNLAYSIAGQVVEAASGMPWAEYVGRNIFGPLGMTSSSVDRDDPGLATGYGRRMSDGSRDVMPFVDARGMAAATGISSTVEDMARFVSAQFRRGARGGDRILSSGSLREMHRIRSVEQNWTVGNAIGFSVSRVGDKTFVGHGGSYPGYITQTLIQLDSRVGVVVLTNAQDGEAGAIARQLYNTVGEAVAKASAARPQVVAWDPAWARFAGLYRGRGGDSQVVLMNERLVIISPSAATLDDPVVLEPLGGGLFRYTARTGGGVVGEVVRFVEDGGRVVRMITGDSYVERVQDPPPPQNRDAALDAALDGPQNAAPQTPESAPFSPHRPVATYSIVARDPATGEMGVAVQSHWFSVGSIVTWAEAGVGAVATQSFVEPSYGPLGLQLMRMGRSAPEALKALVGTDADEAVRQVAMVDAQGRVAAHTGARAIYAAGHHVGEGFSTQANMMENPTVWDAMARAFEGTQGDLADRLLAALEAAEAEGGDIRGRQSAAIIVVSGTSTGKPWVDRKFDLRIEDHPTPVPELRRLVQLQRAYNALNEGDGLMTVGDTEGAMRSYTRAMELVPDEATNGEAPYWVGITLAASGRQEEAIPYLLRAQLRDARWAELTLRLPAAGLLPSEEVARGLAERMRAGK